MRKTVAQEQATEMQTQQTRTEATPPPAHRYLTLERAKEIVAKTDAVAAILAPFDGPTGTPRR